MNRKNGIIAVIALTAFLGTAFLAPVTARASEEGKRNTTLGLGAAAAALLLTQKNKLPGILAAGGAAYAYSQYQHDIDKRHRRAAEARAYRAGYHRGYRYHRHRR